MFFVINKLSKKIKFNKLMILSIVLGIQLQVLVHAIAGFPEDPTKVTWLTEVSKWYGLFGYGFMDLLKMWPSSTCVCFNSKSNNELKAR